MTVSWAWLTGSCMTPSLPRMRASKPSLSSGNTCPACVIRAGSRHGHISYPGQGLLLRSQTASPLEDGPQSPPDDPPTAVDGLGSVVVRDQLEQGLRKISLDHRAVLVLHYYIDLPIEQVAVALDIPPGTVKSRLHRAHQALRGALEADARPTTVPIGSEVAR